MKNKPMATFIASEHRRIEGTGRVVFVCYLIAASLCATLIVIGA